MKHLKYFNEHSLYIRNKRQNKFITTTIEDNNKDIVSYCKKENELHYDEYYYDHTNGHTYIDLGLPSGTKWATMNVGAENITDHGNYYMYGKGATQYNSSDSSYTGIENPLSASVDTAAQVWGSSWHMPTKAQFEELINNTTREWVTIDGTNGTKFIAQNGNYVFLPAAGYWNNDSLSNVGSRCSYWSSTPSSNDSAYSVNFRWGGSWGMGGSSRRFGNSVRPVMDE